MRKIDITRFSDTEFHFELEYEDPARVECIKNLKKFEYEGRHYSVLNVIETFDISGYHSFLVRAELI